jgi:hypothetical protein
MHNINRGGLDRHSDNGRSKVAAKRTKPASGLIGSVPKFLDVIKTSCPQHTRGAM